MTQLSTESDSEDVVARFRSLMAGFPSGVSIVTAFGPNRQPKGMTCSSLCSVTLTPPTLLVCLRQESPTLRAILWREAFAVNLLHADAQSTAELFASGKSDRFDEVTWRGDHGDVGPRLLDDAHAVAHCELVKAEQVGDHVVVLGAVFGMWLDGQRQPLLYGLRQYASWPRALTSKE